MNDNPATAEDHAKTMRHLAQLTAENSKNWDNFERICKDMIQAAFDAGKASK